MTIFQHLQLQPIDADDDTDIDEQPLQQATDDDIVLEEQIDEQALEAFWQGVEDDLHAGAGPVG